MSADRSRRPIPEEIGRTEAEAFERRAKEVVRRHSFRQTSDVFPNKELVIHVKDDGGSITASAPEEGSRQPYHDTEVWVRHTHPGIPEGGFTVVTEERFFSDLPRRDFEGAREIFQKGFEEPGEPESTEPEMPWIYYRRRDKVYGPEGEDLNEAIRSLSNGDLEPTLDEHKINRESRVTAEALGLHHLPPEKFPGLMDLLDEIDEDPS